MNEDLNEDFDTEIKLKEFLHKKCDQADYSNRREHSLAVQTLIGQYTAISTLIAVGEVRLEIATSLMKEFMSDYDNVLESWIDFAKAEKSAAEEALVSLDRIGIHTKK